MSLPVCPSTLAVPKSDLFKKLGGDEIMMVNQWPKSEAVWADGRALATWHAGRKRRKKKKCSSRSSSAAAGCSINIQLLKAPSLSILFPRCAYFLFFCCASLSCASDSCSRFVSPSPLPCLARHGLSLLWNRVWLATVGKKVRRSAVKPGSKDASCSRPRHNHATNRRESKTAGRACAETKSPTPSASLDVCERSGGN